MSDLLLFIPVLGQNLVGLFFHPATLAVASLDEAIAQIDALPGEVSARALAN